MPTLIDLFKMAITSEYSFQAFYLGLADKCPRHPEIAAFWKGMAEDEKKHAQHLQKIQENLPAGTLQSAADYDILMKAQNVQRFSTKEALGKIKNLDDALETAHEMENSEVNAVFAFLAAYAPDPKDRGDFIASEIREHTMKLFNFFNAKGSRAWRKTIILEK